LEHWNNELKPNIPLGNIPVFQDFVLAKLEKCIV